MGLTSGRLFASVAAFEVLWPTGKEISLTNARCTGTGFSRERDGQPS